MASDAALTTSVGYVNPKALSAIASFAHSLKSRITGMLDLEQGQRVLDVGCGPGVDLAALCAVVRESGMVIGIDADANMANQASARLEGARAGSIARSFVADATSLPFRSGVFDRCRCERVLQHLRESTLAVSELFRVAKANGLVVAADTDWASLSIDCEDIGLERRIVRAVSDCLANGYAGRQLVRLMRSAGFEVVDLEVQPIVWTNFAQFQSTSFPATGVVRALLASGDLSAREWEQFVGTCDRADRQGAFFASATVAVVAGRKPC